MDSQTKMKFPTLCRQLRVENRLKQREVASAIGMKTSSYGNVESVNHKSLAVDRVHRLARFYQLDEAKTAELLAAWEELPASEYAQRQTKTFAERRAFRSKAANHDRLKVSLLELATLLITSCENPGALCTCEQATSEMLADASFFPDGSPDGVASSTDSLTCELCTALQLLGLPLGMTTRDEVITKLAEVQEAMSAVR
jgi:transcriptional regulator with XRE-family HTH domain